MTMDERKDVNSTLWFLEEKNKAEFGSE